MAHGAAAMLGQTPFYGEACIVDVEEGVAFLDSFRRE